MKFVAYKLSPTLSIIGARGRVQPVKSFFNEKTTSLSLTKKKLVRVELSRPFFALCLLDEVARERWPIVCQSYTCLDVEHLWGQLVDHINKHEKFRPTLKRRIFYICTSPIYVSLLPTCGSCITIKVKQFI